MEHASWPAELRIIKVGGSLLQSPELVSRFRRWLASQPERTTLLLAGGGGLADWVRESDARFRLGQVAAHWIAAGTLGVTSRLLGCLLPEAGQVPRWAELPGLLTQRPAQLLWVVDPDEFLRTVEPHLPGRTLPQSWDVTSDSIAARMAVVVEAVELVLLKSCPCPALDLSAAARNGYVDADFPQAAATLRRIRWVDLIGGCQGLWGQAADEGPV